MAEMYVTAPGAPVKVLDEYDFLFNNGQAMPITIDSAAGDTLHITDTMITVDLVAKPSRIDPSNMLPAEDVIIYKHQLMAVQHRKREVSAMTPEQQFEWSRLLAKEIAGPTN